MNNLFIINDMANFIDATRTMVFINFGTDDSTLYDDSPISINDLSTEDLLELDRILSHKESAVIVKEHTRKQKHKISNEVRHIISEESFMSIVNDLHSRMISNILKDLVKKGLIEMAFDDNKNDFIFWIKDENTQQEKPETD